MEQWRGDRCRGNFNATDGNDLDDVFTCSFTVCCQQGWLTSKFMTEIDQKHRTPKKRLMPLVWQLYSLPDFSH